MPKAKTQTIEIGIDRVVQTATVIFITAELIPTEEDIRATVEQFLRAKCGEPMRKAALELMETPLFQCSVADADSLPLPPYPFLRACGMTEIEERRVDEAEKLIFVDVTDVNRPPCVGLWLRRAACAALVSQYRGVVFDPTFPRVVPLNQLDKSIPGAPPVAVSDHLMAPESVDEDELITATTSGMARFGLPDIRLSGAPPQTGDECTALLFAVAQLLVENVYSQIDKDGMPPEAITVEDEIQLSPQHLERADNEIDAEHRPPIGVTVGLQLADFDEDDEEDDTAVIEIIAPLNEKREHEEWLADVLHLFHQRSRTIRPVLRDDQEMQKAAHRAMAELSVARVRFQDGLRPGEALFVKHGFPVSGGAPEYMWIAVTDWSDKGSISGRLANHPRRATQLKEGKAVKIAEPEIFDWLIVEPDGRHIGGYTNIADD